MTSATAARSPSSSWAWFAADSRRVDVVVALVTVALSAVLIVGSPERYDTGWPEVAAGVGVFALVLFRRRRPFPLLAIAVGWTALHAAIWERPSSMIFATLVLLATACVRLERGPAVGLGIVVGTILYGVAYAVGDDLEFGDGRALIALVWTAAAVGVADATRSWRRYRESVDAQVRAAVHAAEAEARQQVTEERLAIARELHDLLAHSLSVMNVQTGAALHLLPADPDKAEESLIAARDAGRSVLDELRELLAVLRDDGDDGAPRSSLPTVDDLAMLVDSSRAAGLTVTWTDVGQRSELAPAASLAAYRIVQEALTNAARHGDGPATLTTEWDADHLVITVVNPSTAATPVTSVDPAGDPAGHQLTTSGHGLVGMRERAVANGGSLDAGPTSSGFLVRARLPASARPSEARS